MRRWSQLSNIEKFDAYTRWSLYALIAVIPFGLLEWSADIHDGRPMMQAAFWAGAGALTIGCLLASRQLMSSERSGMHVSPPVTAVVLLAAASLIIVTMSDDAATDDGMTGQGWIILIAISFAIGCTAATISFRYTTAICAVAAIGSAFLWLRGANPREVTLGLIGAFALYASAAVAMRASINMLRLMRRIDDAREVESQLAVAEERLRFARDLHDTLGHNLSAIALKSQVARGQIARDPEAAGAEVDAVRALADESLSEMRAVVRGYRDADLDAELSGARSLLASAGIACSVVGSAADADELAWVVREAVTNVIRHSDAHRCLIELSQADGRSSVRVWNDGARSPSASRKAGGNGIEGLRARLTASGGSLVVNRPRAGEFELTATVERQPSLRRGHE